MNEINNEVSLQEMLDAREQKVFHQNELFRKDNAECLLSFGLNIPGPVKRSELFDYAFEYGCQCILQALSSNKIDFISSEKKLSKTGNELYITLNYNPLYIKELMVPVENDEDIGRLFDIDILDRNLEKVSRTEFGDSRRKCIICDKEAYICSRNRAHSVSEMINKINSIIEAHRNR